MDAIDTRYFLHPETGRPVRVELHHDDDARDSPRDDHDHFAILLTRDSSYLSSDKDGHIPRLDRAVRHFGEWNRSEGYDAAKLARYARIFLPGEILFVGGLRRNTYDGTLTLYVGDRLDIYDSYDGIAVVTAGGWRNAMGYDYRGEVTPQQLVEQELAEYNAWAGGEIYGYKVIEADDDGNEDGKEVDSCWRMIGDSSYAMAEGVMYVMGERTVGEGRTHQGMAFELTAAEFEDAVEGWAKEHGHRATGTGWPRA